MYQICGILILTVGTASLLIWICFLHRSLQQQNKLILLPPAKQFVSQESRVMIGRSTRKYFPDNPVNDHVLT